MSFATAPHIAQELATLRHELRRQADEITRLKSALSAQQPAPAAAAPMPAPVPSRAVEHLRLSVEDLKRDVANLRQPPAADAVAPKDAALLAERAAWAEHNIHRLYTLLGQTNSRTSNAVCMLSFMVGELMGKTFPKLWPFIEEVEAIIGKDEPVFAKLPKGRNNSNI